MTCALPRHTNCQGEGSPKGFHWSQKEGPLVCVCFGVFFVPVLPHRTLPRLCSAPPARGCGQGGLGYYSTPSSASTKGSRSKEYGTGFNYDHETTAKPAARKVLEGCAQGLERIWSFPISCSPPHLGFFGNNQVVTTPEVEFKK